MHTKTTDKENFDNVDKYILNGGFKGLKKAVSTMGRAMGLVWPPAAWAAKALAGDAVMFCLYVGGSVEIGRAHV